jgi:DNA-binding beta-propeller fold protein YncE
VIARIDAAGSIDASTTLVGPFEQSSIRGAVTNDGSAFWVSGSANVGTGGIWYATLGPAGSLTQITTAPNMTRNVEIFNGQLYAVSGSALFSAPFAVGTGLPTSSGQASNTLPGFTVSGASPCAFAFNASGNVAYVADSRALASGGGVQKWSFDGVSWSLVTTFTNGISIGVTGLCVDFTIAQPRVYATTAATPNAIVGYVDDGSLSPTGTVLATAATNTAFRGIALGPYGSQAAVDGAGDGAAFGILACVPQPCVEGARVQYVLPAPGRARLELFDAHGRRVATLVEGTLPAGRHSTALDARGLASGVYVLRLQAGARAATRKLAHLR